MVFVSLSIGWHGALQKMAKLRYFVLYTTENVALNHTSGSVMGCKLKRSEWYCPGDRTGAEPGKDLTCHL